MTRPNGSSHWIGLSRAHELPMSSYFSSVSSSPRYSAFGPSAGRTTPSKYSCSAGSCIFAAMRSGMPAMAAASMASGRPFDGCIRPTKHAVSPPGPTGTSSTWMPWGITRAIGTGPASDAWFSEIATNVTSGTPARYNSCSSGMRGPCATVTTGMPLA